MLTIAEMTLIGECLSEPIAELSDRLAAVEALLKRREADFERIVEDACEAALQRNNAELLEAFQRAFHRD